MTSVGVSLAHFRDLVLTLCRTLREGFVCLLRGLAAATFSAASGKAPALLQTRQKLWNHSATLMVSPSCRKLSAQNVLQDRHHSWEANKRTCNQLPSTALHSRGNEQTCLFAARQPSAPPVHSPSSGYMRWHWCNQIGQTENMSRMWPR